MARELGDGLYATLQLPEFVSAYSWVPFLVWGTVLDDGEATDSDHARAAGGPGWALAYHGAYEFGGPDAVRTLPGGAEWMDVVERTPAEQRHLSVHVGALRRAQRGRPGGVARGRPRDAGRRHDERLPGQIRERLAELSAKGVTEIVFQPCGPDSRASSSGSGAAAPGERTMSREITPWWVVNLRRVPALARGSDLVRRLLQPPGASAEEDGSDLAHRGRGASRPVSAGCPTADAGGLDARPARCSAARPTAPVTHADLGAHVGGHPNDMVVDAQGRAYVGNFGFDLMGGAPVETATLLRVDPDGSVTAVAQDLWFPNGSVITDDGVLIVDETFGNRVSAFDIADDGALTNRRIWAKFAELPTDRDLHDGAGPVTFAPDGCAWTPRVRCGSPTPSAARLIRVRGRRRDRRRDRSRRHRRVRLHARRRRRAHAVRLRRARLRREGPLRRPRGGLLAVRVEVPHAGRP